MSFQITLENPHHPICLELIAELSAELARLYGDDGGEHAFSLEDALHSRAAFVVAWLDGKPVGCGALRPMADETIAEIKRMYVKPSVRGQGISKHLIFKLEALAREFGYRAIWLETGILQPEAIGLYESAGYHRMGCYGQYTDNPLSLCFEKMLT
jgi:hypothetical protein